MLTVVAFIVALGLLIAIHEYGHYRMAVACGVKVLRFSVGFGHTLLRWQPKGSPTEFVLGAFPLGGYVRMLDEREAPVASGERHLAFNTQPLRSRALIVAAGPLANLLLAVLLYAVVNWSGVQMASAVLGAPVAASVAERAGLRGGERVERAGFDGGELKAMASFEDVRWLLTRGALEGRDVRLELSDARARAPTEVVLPLASMAVSDADAQLFERIGIVAPLSRPEIGDIVPGSAADRAGLRPGDLVLDLGGVIVKDGRQLRELIRASVREGQALTKSWRIERKGAIITLDVTPEVQQQGAAVVGRIGAYVGAAPEMIMVQHGVLEGLWLGVEKTWDVSLLTVRTLGRMLVGEASLKNLSGPLTIADYAGRSASMGLTQYLVFLALISVSLGVLNLLPLPVLDGGHLMYYLWEGVTGKPVADVWLERMQRAGVAVLALMMSIALFNDLARLLG
ncbi:MAG: RIP metalloprotease RseP [Hylemonella sp.]|nr:RIP metalloprotease RseP [Hylemonella sp.]